MVDVKRVTATIKKPSIYGSPVNTSVTDENIDIDPTASVPTIYSIDPFAVFQRSSSRLEVKIPFTRFYRIKTVLSYSGFVTSGTSVDAFSMSKPLIGSTDTLTVNRISNNITTVVNSNIFTQDASGYVVFDPNDANATTFTKRYALTPAIVEGIVELYAGDTLYFTHTRNFFSQITIQGLSGGIYVVEPGSPPPPSIEPYLLAGNRTYAGGSLYANTSYVGGLSINNPYALNGNLLTQPYSSNSSFFFEISEITDL